MNIKFLKISLIVVTILALWFLVGSIFPCDKFTYLPDGEHLISSCTCIGKKIDYNSDERSIPGDYGAKCMGLIVYRSIGEKNTSCIDTDDGKNIYAKGDVTTVKDGKALRTISDYCTFKDKNGNIWPGKTSCNGENCFISEAYCYNKEKQKGQEDWGWTGGHELLLCPNGCSDGTCAFE